MRVKDFISEFFGRGNYLFFSLRFGWADHGCFFFRFFRVKLSLLFFFLLKIDHFSYHLFHFNALLKLVKHMQLFVLVSLLVSQVLLLLVSVLLVFQVELSLTLVLLLRCQIFCISIVSSLGVTEIVNFYFVGCKTFLLLCFDLVYEVLGS